ncbi:hypothetical protein [Aquimarina sp. 2201CG5-10]|uniref:hypothetical protein n=1 Tax=Aquimarina callyspongiae TaxID=3098150 RepID=UPI002AB588D1|nr:hypothetical protein [Aquimarina sp. 2201CG5-10]MDY8135915.1 hypothetical protein [Aquimarina sp. 2201CG5-10]
MKNAKILLLPLLLMSITITGQNTKEAIQNTAQIVQGKKNLERDIKELKAIQIKMVSFNKAFDIKDETKTNDIKRDIISDIIREVKQSEEKAKQARREIAQSSAEIRSDRAEIRRNRDDSDRGRYDRQDDQRDMARDQINKNDDKRDRRDDIGDLKLQITVLERQAHILETLKTFNFSFNSNQLEKSVVNKKLLKEFIDTLQQDIEITKRELAEDNRERKEDRRERRDDRTERQEYNTVKKRRW